jgi:hypothetical protein
MSPICHGGLRSHDRLMSGYATIYMQLESHTLKICDLKKEGCKSRCSNLNDYFIVVYFIKQISYI